MSDDYAEEARKLIRIRDLERSIKCHQDLIDGELLAYEPRVDWIAEQLGHLARAKAEHRALTVVRVPLSPPLGRPPPTSVPPAGRGWAAKSRLDRLLDWMFG